MLQFPILDGKVTGGYGQASVAVTYQCLLWQFPILGGKVTGGYGQASVAVTYQCLS